MRNNYKGKAVLITGGTRGIGLATGMAFARQGAHVYLTYRWGSVKEEDVLGRFEQEDLPKPSIVEADVSANEDTDALLDLIAQDHDGVEAFVSNVAVVQPARGIESYKKRHLLRSLEYSAWPLVEYTKRIHKKFSKYPRYVIGVSSDGPDAYFSNYEFVAVSKAVMETFCRYLSKHLQDEDIRFNVIRTRNVLTEAVYEIFGEDYVKFVGKYAGEEYFIEAEEIGDAILAMCSGMLDALNGQVIQVDKGVAFADTLMRLLDRREELGLTY